MTATPSCRSASDRAGACGPPYLPDYSPPNFLSSSDSASVSSRGTSPWATFSACTWCRICSTISGLASVVTSPTSAKLETDAITRRMIMPDRVYGDRLDGLADVLREQFVDEEVPAVDHRGLRRVLTGVAPPDQHLVDVLALLGRRRQGLVRLDLVIGQLAGAVI